MKRDNGEELQSRRRWIGRAEDEGRAWGVVLRPLRNRSCEDKCVPKQRSLGTRALKMGKNFLVARSWRIGNHLTVKTIRRWSLYVFLSAVLASCSEQQPQVATTSSSAARFASAPTDRPGLGTKWGETRQSRVDIVQFERADRLHPIASARIYYNDEVGIRAMAGTASWMHEWPILAGPVASLVAIGLKDQSGWFLPGLMVGDRWFVIGEQGRRYSIVVRNKSDLRLEVVLSVDGLDVLDGRKASLSKRGYILAPHAEVVVDGFRQSTEAVAAFRFSPVRESYAHQKYGDTRNVGVIGAAVFNERGTNPLTSSEVQKRLKANPFPGRFATPP